MAVINVVSSTPKKKAKPYPKIMKSEMYLVLFNDVGIGTIISVLHSSAAWCIGDNKSCIPMSDYEDHNEPVTLQNK